MHSAPNVEPKFDKPLREHDDKEVRDLDDDEANAISTLDSSPFTYLYLSSDAIPSANHLDKRNASR